ncbi:FAD-dependent monooxygenase [Dactylosporangium sp. CA-092794]|uniref:FAD-dependent monooxygenase n=1 Tax=Dactylosporangium sp. CA-092794 TaxID=3239929 RepID=UPI003D8C5E93
MVGAGPSGLMTAALLIRRGVAVRIIDANTGPSTQSRAFAVQARTIELFRSMNPTSSTSCSRTAGWSGRSTTPSSGSS